MSTHVRLLIVASLTAAHASAQQWRPMSRGVELSVRVEHDLEAPWRTCPPAIVRSADASEPPFRVLGFYDGDDTWRFRIHLPRPGRYAYEISDASPLGGRGGTFTVDHAHPDDSIAVADDGTHLTTADGRPFFWLADTAWNGVLKATDAEFADYLSHRSRQRFGVCQFVTTPWRGGRETLDRHPFAFDGPRWTGIDVEKLRRMDDRIVALNDAGIVAAPVMLWGLTAEDPGRALDENEAIDLTRYQLARWGAYRCVWMLGGDCAYDDVRRWKRIGESLVARGNWGPMRPLITLHPNGLNHVADEFADASWIGFWGYQSGHGVGEKDLEFFLGDELRTFPPPGGPRPIINLEPNYEDHPAYKTGIPHDAAAVRRAAWWSTLIHPTAGVTYGHNAVWVWNHADGEPAENHGFIVDGYAAGLSPPGANDMTLLRDFYESGPWHDLWPIGVENPSTPRIETVVAAATGDGRWTVAYTPAGRPVELPDAPEPDATATWIDPSTGRSLPAAGSKRTYDPPDANRDWVLSIRRTP